MSATAKASWITPQKDSESGLMFPVCGGEIQKAAQRMNKVPKSGESDADVRSASCLFVLVGPDHGRLLSGLGALLRLAPLKLWGGEEQIVKCAQANRSAPVPFGTALSVKELNYPVSKSSPGAEPSPSSHPHPNSA